MVKSSMKRRTKPLTGSFQKSPFSWRPWSSQKWRDKRHRDKRQGNEWAEVCFCLGSSCGERKVHKHPWPALMGLGSIVSAGVMRLIPFDQVISTMLDTDIIPLMMEKDGEHAENGTCYMWYYRPNQGPVYTVAAVIWFTLILHLCCLAFYILNLAGKHSPVLTSKNTVRCSCHLPNIYIFWCVN